MNDIKNINRYIDYTILRPDAKNEDIIKLCHEANTYRFKSVCVNAAHIVLVKEHINPEVNICSVISFPLGATTTNVKVYETKEAISLGANEIDMVINIGMLKDANHTYVYNEITEISDTCHEKKAILKVIIETCLLTDNEIITACNIAQKAGADFVKTSTGFSVKGADIEKEKLMRKIVGPHMGVKASGGIRTYADAVAMLEAGADRLGTSAVIQVTSNR